MARSPVLVACAFLLLAAVCQAADDPTIKLKGVHDLTADNFATTITGSKAALIEFYAPWCGHCKHLVPEYKKLGELIAADPKLSSRVVIAKVDADSHRSLGEQFGVQGFPTIKWFPRGKAPSKDNAKDYTGGRTAEAFLEHIKAELAADSGFARVEALDKLVDGFVDAKDKAAIVTKVTAAVKELSGDELSNGEVYVKVLEKAVEKGADYLTKEKARLDKMLNGGGVAAAKVEELSRKLSVISAILGDDE